MHHNFNEKEIEILKEGGKRLYEILHKLKDFCKVGIMAKEIDTLAEKLILENGDIPVFKDYKPSGASYPFPASLCVSINNVVAHGIPKDEILNEGDIVSLDLGLKHNGLVVDSAISFLIGDHEKYPKESKLLEVTKKALEIGINECRVGKRVNDVGIAIEKYVNEVGFNVVDILCGHGVGRVVHTEPQIPHADYGPGGKHFKEGMVLAIEPHISLGSGEIKLSKKDNWAYETIDGSKTAQFEHTILVTNGDPIVLTTRK